MMYGTLPVKDAFYGYEGEITKELVDSAIGCVITDIDGDEIGKVTGVHWDKQEVYIELPGWFMNLNVLGEKL